MTEVMVAVVTGASGIVVAAITLVAQSRKATKEVKATIGRDGTKTVMGLLADVHRQNRDVAARIDVWGRRSYNTERRVADLEQRVNQGPYYGP